MTTWKPALALALVGLLATAARADDAPPYVAPETSIAATIPAPGTALDGAARAKLQALVDSDPQLRKQVMSAAKDEIKDTYERAEEDKASATFAEQKKFVIAAYGIMWVLLVVFLGMMWRRQRVLEREIEVMAGKLAKHKNRDRRVTSGHFIYIPMVLAFGTVVGFILGGRAARDALAAQQKRDEERAAAKEARLKAKAAAAAAPPPDPK